MAEAIVERTSKKLEKSLGKAKVVQARSKKWDDVNKAVQESKANAFAVLQPERDEEGAGKEWETDEEMDGDAEAGDAAVAQSAVAAPVLDDDDDEIL